MLFDHLIMAADRSIGRNVHLYDAKDRGTVLGGLILTSGVTKSNFYSMVEILLLFQSSFTIGHENSATLVRNEEPLAPGKYYVVGKPLDLILGGAVGLWSTGSFTVNNEPCLTRTISLSTGSRLQSFRDEIRKRDGRCVITGKIALGAYRNHWKGFEAAHIFPLAYEGHWVQHNFARWITIPAANGETINSKQNGLLLRADIHGLFDSYDISINPDVRPHTPTLEFPATNHCRTIIKSFILRMMEMASQANFSMSNFAMITIDLLMNFYGGIFDKLCLRI